MIPRFPIYFFDLDGTLIDSSEDICGAVTDLLDEDNRALWPTERLRRYIGLHLGEMFRDIFPSYSASQIDSLIVRYRDTYFAREHSATTLYDEVRETLAHISGRKAVATSRRVDTARRLLEKFGILQFFDHVQGTDHIPCKPAPDILVACMEALGAAPQDCLMVGDSPADLQAARSAGIASCVVTYGYGDPQRIQELQPNYWISSLRELVS
ncbi:MAG: HAD-IA family hydrolase [Bryobacterales bacterium]|nr:HAD-IA family hydrolase [Bryobacterales bacterium]